MGGRKVHFALGPGPRVSSAMLAGAGISGAVATAAAALLVVVSPLAVRLAEAAKPTCEVCSSAVGGIVKVGRADHDFLPFACTIFKLHRPISPRSLCAHRHANGTQHNACLSSGCAMV